MNFSDLQTAVIDRTGRPDKVTVIQDALNNGLKKLMRSHPFDKMRKTATLVYNSGDTQVAMPSDVHQLVTVTFQDPSIPTASYPLILIRKTQFLKMFPNVTGSVISGRALFCCRDDQNQVLLLDRHSIGTFHIVITYTFHQKFVLPTDEPLIPGVDEALVAYATASVYRAIQMYDDAKAWDMQFAVLMRDLVLDVEREIGLSTVAKEFENARPRSSTNPPWLDPFDGRRDSIQGW